MDAYAEYLQALRGFDAIRANLTDAVARAEQGARHDEAAAETRHRAAVSRLNRIARSADSRYRAARDATSDPDLRLLLPADRGPVVEQRTPGLPELMAAQRQAVDALRLAATTPPVPPMRPAPTPPEPARRPPTSPAAAGHKSKTGLIVIIAILVVAVVAAVVVLVTL